jgi:hypothetical protein
MHPVSSEEAGVLGVSLVRNTGYAVFPCKEDKTPATRNGVHNASNDPARVANLWEVSPGPLIGIATGAASGVDVLDIDSGRHPEADAWWKAATSGEIRPSILPTRVYRTRSGGLHAYYRHTPGVVNTASKLARGVDTRGCGGYAIYWFAAGCPCENEAPPSPWPAWLLNALFWKPPPKPVFSGKRIEHADKAINGALRLVRQAAVGERNKVLHWAACRLAERTAAGQIGHSEAQALLLAAAQEAGLTGAEASRTVASAFRKAA